MHFPEIYAILALMCPSVNTKDPAVVESEVRAAYLGIFPSNDSTFISEYFSWAVRCFNGQYLDYQPIDARYHDLEHTLQGTLCMFRLLHGRHRSGVQPLLTERLFRLGLLAILLHDTGYLKRKEDKEGTGAKYTLIHVSRSTDFAAVLLAENGFSERDIRSVQNMIRCTGVNVNLASITFQSDLERTIGFVLGTADLLGQMAADDYIEKLPILYQEFEESEQFNARNSASRMVFTSAAELMQKTPAFWEKYVIPRVTNQFEGLFKFLESPYPGGRNEYFERIEANIDRLKRQLNPSLVAS